MADIDIGSPAIDRASGHGQAYTIICMDNPANAAGKITKIQIRAVPGWIMSDPTLVGTFYGTPPNFTNRDYANVGTVDGYKEITGLSIDVQAGDYLGVHLSYGKIEQDLDGFAGIYRKSGNYFGGGEETYVFMYGDTLSVYGEGESLPKGGGASMAAKLIGAGLL